MWIRSCCIGGDSCEKKNVVSAMYDTHFIEQPSCVWIP